jgi:hypothetical protein
MRSKSRALTIDELRARFEEWRQNRQGKSPIPDELWAAAVELARKDGVNRTAAELHLRRGQTETLDGSESSLWKASSGVRGTAASWSYLDSGMHD